MVASDTYTWGIKDFHKCWSGPLAERRLCLGPAGVTDCPPLSALSFCVSLSPRTCGHNSGNSSPKVHSWELCHLGQHQADLQKLVKGADAACRPDLGDGGEAVWCCHSARGREAGCCSPARLFLHTLGTFRCWRKTSQEVSTEKGSCQWAEQAWAGFRAPSVVN